MKNKVLYSVCFISLLIYSCRNKNTNHTSTKISTDSSYFKPNYKYIHLIPDSLRTEEQNLFLEKLATVIKTYQKIDHDSLVFKLSKKDFLSMGFPIEYYELIEKDLKNNNDFFRKNNIKLVDSMLNPK